MRWPWISRARYMRELTKAREAYRWERDEALAKVGKVERERQELLDRLIPHVSILPRDLRDVGPQVKIVLSVREEFFDSNFTSPDWNYIAQKIIRDLSGAQRDYRPDLRDPDPVRSRLLRPL